MPVSRRTLFRLALGAAAFASVSDPLRRYFIIGQPERRLAPRLPVVLSGVLVVVGRDCLRGQGVITANPPGWMRVGDLFQWSAPLFPVVRWEGMTLSGSSGTFDASKKAWTVERPRGISPITIGVSC